MSRFLSLLSRLVASQPVDPSTIIAQQCAQVARVAGTVTVQESRS